MKGIMNIFLVMLIGLQLISCKSDDCPPDLVDNTSSVVWKRAFEKIDLTSTPIYYEGLVIAGHPSSLGYTVYAYDALIGDLVWNTALSPGGSFEPRSAEEAILYKDKVVYSDGRSFFVLEAASGEIVWWKKDENARSSVWVIDDYVYKVLEDTRNWSTLARYDINTGSKEELFTINRTEYGENYSPGLLMPVKWVHPSGDEILILQNRTFGWYTDMESKMDVLAWNLTADSMLWYRDSLDGSSSSARPAIDGNKVYFFGTWNAYCIYAATGETLWNYDIGAEAGGSFASANILIVDDKLIVKADYDAMHAVNKETGVRIWYNPDTEASPSLLTVHNDTIWFSSAGVFGIDAITGEKLINDWNPGYGDWLFPIAIHPTNGNIYTSDAQYLYCLDPKKMN